MDDSLRQLLTLLHRKLESATSIGETDRELLTRLSGDIQAVLAQPSAHSSSRHASLLGRLEAAATHFESTHPDLTATMLQVSKVLGDMGI